MSLKFTLRFEPKHGDLLSRSLSIRQAIIRDDSALVSYSRSRAYLQRLRWPLWKRKVSELWQVY